MTQPVGNYSPHVLVEQGSDIPYIVNAAGARVALALAGNTNTLVAQTKFVSKGGSDTTGDGSLAKPFLTIQAAITAITDAGITKPYSIVVAPGIYTDAFRLVPYIDVCGMSQEGTILNPVTANWMAASWAGAVVGNTGLSNLTLRSAFVADLATLVATGAAVLNLFNVVMGTGGSIACTGHVTSQILNLDGITATDVSTSLSITDWNSNIGSVYTRNGNITLTTTDKFTMLVRAGSLTCTAGVFSMVSPAAGANTMFVTVAVCAQSAVSPTITGNRVEFVSTSMVGTYALTDANATLSFTSPHAASSIIGIDGGLNLFSITPTADRTLTIEAATANLNRGTRIRIKNHGAFFVTLTFSGATCDGPSYIQPFGTFDAWINNAHTTWEAAPQVQRGTVTLTNGITALITCDLATQSSITFGVRLPGGTLGSGGLMAFNGDRANGIRGGGGGFKITAIDLSGTLVATDTSQVDWQVD